MRTIDANLSAAIAAGVSPSNHVFCYKADNSGGSDGIVVKYKLGRLSGTVWIQGLLTDEDSYLQIQTLCNGQAIPRSEKWFIKSSQAKLFEGYSNANRPISEISVTAFDINTYQKSSSADQPVSAVLANLMSTNTTATFLTQTWNTYQFRPAGSILKPQKFEGVLGLLWNQYCAKMFPRDNGECLFRVSSPMEFGEPQYDIEKTWSHNFKTRVTANVQTFNPFWIDETGATHRLSAFPGYADLANYRIRNVGFFPSTANPDYLYQLLVEQPYTSKNSYKIRPDFEIQQGDIVKIPTTSDKIIANITESYNMSTDSYPWHMIIKGESMTYEY